MLIRGVGCFDIWRLIICCILFYMVLFFTLHHRGYKSVEIPKSCFFKNVCFWGFRQTCWMSGTKLMKKSHLKQSLISYIIIYKLECACFRMLICSLLTASGLCSFNNRISTFLLDRFMQSILLPINVWTPTTFIILPIYEENSSLLVHVAESLSHTNDLWDGVKCNAESSTCWLLHQH